MIIFGKMLTYFQMKNNNNTFIVSYTFNDKAVFLWIQSGCGREGQQKIKSLTNLIMQYVI